MPHEKKVGELMIPLTDYPHIPYWFTIKQAIAIVKKTALGLEGKAEPSTLLVFDEKYQLMGSLTMEDLIRGIEKKFVRANGYTVRDFEESMRRQIVLHVAGAEMADGLLQWPESRGFFQGKLGPTALVVLEKDVDALTVVLRELGIEVRFEMT